MESVVSEMWVMERRGVDMEVEVEVGIEEGVEVVDVDVGEEAVVVLVEWILEVK